MENKLKLISKTKLVSDAKNGITRQDKYYEFNGRKFKIRYEESNGSPLGFNSKKCLLRYDEVAGKWNALEDIRTLDMKERCTNYFDMGSALREMKEFFSKMERHIKTVYA